MGLGLKIRSGQKLDTNVMTRPELMAAHFEMLLDATRKGLRGSRALNDPRSRKALEAIINNYEYIVESRIPKSIMIWFIAGGEPSMMIELEFDWASMQMKIRNGDNAIGLFDFSKFASGGSMFAVPDEARKGGGSDAGGVPLPELRGHANLLQEIITELCSRETITSLVVQAHYPGPKFQGDKYSQWAGITWSMWPRSDFEKRLQMETLGYGRGGVSLETMKIKSETNPDLTLSVSKVRKK